MDELREILSVIIDATVPALADEDADALENRVGEVLKLAFALGRLDALEDVQLSAGAEVES